MAVVPGDELRRGVRPTEVLAGDSRAPVDRRAYRVADDVVALEQLPAADVGPELDMTEEAKPLVLRGPVVGPRDRLDLRGVRSDAGPDQAIRGRQAVVEIDGDRRLGDGQQLARGIEAARAGADDGDTEWR